MAALTAARFSLTSPCCSATTRTCIPTTCRSSAAKGGPGGKPGCGSLPDVTKNFPVRQLVTNTGWEPAWIFGPTPASGIPCYDRLVPGDPRRAGGAQHPSVHSRAGNRAGAVSGAPPYGAPLYGRAAVPLWPGAAGGPNPGPAQPATENGQTPP